MITVCSVKLWMCSLRFCSQQVAVPSRADECENQLVIWPFIRKDFNYISSYSRFWWLQSGVWLERWQVQIPDQVEELDITFFPRKIRRCVLNCEPTVNDCGWTGRLPFLIRCNWGVFLYLTFWLWVWKVLNGGARLDSKIQRRGAYLGSE